MLQQTQSACFFVSFMHFRPYMSTAQEYLECPVTDSVRAITTTVIMYCKYAYIQSRNERGAVIGP